MRPLLLQGIWALLCLLYIRKKVLFCSRIAKDFVWDKELYQDLLSQGFAMGLHDFHRFDWNGLSSNPLLISLEQPLSVHRSQPVVSCPFAVLLITAIASSITTFISQNFGAEQFQRIKKALPLPTFFLGFDLSWFAALLFFTSPSLTSFISARQILILIGKCQSLSPDQLLLLSYFGESHHPEKCPTGMGKN